MLSLAAAFFGLLAKQWLREYMRWNSSLSAPRENVLVRQIRFEAWESWNVAATISSIPALLELAMVLFLIGVDVLLWSLDSVVAVIITAVVIIFLTVAILTSLLPIFLKRCPYKSPTAWACIVVFNALLTSWKALTRRCFMIYAKLRLRLYEWLEARRISNVPRTTRSPHVQPLKPPTRVIASWRDRDLPNPSSMDTVRLRGWPRKPIDVRSMARDELLQEKLYFSDDGRYLPDFLEGRFASQWYWALLLDICETSILLRALSWVGTASQDVQVHRHISDALTSIHPSPPRAIPPMEEMRIHMVANRCISLSAIGSGLQQPYLALLPSALPEPLNSKLSLEVLRAQFIVHVQVRHRGAIDYTIRDDVSNYYARKVGDLFSMLKPVFSSTVGSQYDRDAAVRITLLFIAEQLRDVIKALLSASGDKAMEFSLLRQTAELFKMATIFIRVMKPRDIPILRDLASYVLCNERIEGTLESKVPGLRYAVFSLVLEERLGKIDVVYDENQGV